MCALQDGFKHWIAACPQAVMSIVLGLTFWGAMEVWGGESLWPAPLVDLGFAIAGMLVGSLVTRVPGHTDAALALHRAHTGGQR